jgi:hypothetical protein
MFGKTAPVAAEVVIPDVSPEPEPDLIPLSVLRLDLDPGEPWSSFLGRRGIAFRPDHIGRDAITVGDAQRLIAERRADELRRQALLRAAEQQAVEKDRAWRASLPKGLPWYALEGMSFGEAAAAAEAAAHPSRTPTPGEWMFGETDTMVFHSMQDAAES